MPVSEKATAPDFLPAAAMHQNRHDEIISSDNYSPDPVTSLTSERSISSAPSNLYRDRRSRESAGAVIRFGEEDL